jgi:hypothetical protein
MLVKVTSNTNIEIDPKVIKFINEEKRDFRVCTSCYGSEILPTTMKRPKQSDLTIDVGENTLYISKVQAAYISRVDMSMIRQNYIQRMEKYYL